MIARYVLLTSVLASLAAATGAETTRVLERGPHHRKLETVIATNRPDGTPVMRTNSLVILETGMHYKGEDGAWRPSEELVEPHATGAIARRGPHQVTFAANLNSGGYTGFWESDGGSPVREIGKVYEPR